MVGFTAIFAIPIILLVMFPLTHVNAAVSPEVYKCIHDKMIKKFAGITIALALHRSPKMMTAIDNGVDNYTASIEECLK